MKNEFDQTESWGGPAFPCEGGDNSGLHAHPGMSLRDYLAAQALPAVIGDATGTEEGITTLRILCKEDGVKPDIFIARMAYAYADAMLAVRNEWKGVAA